MAKGIHCRILIIFLVEIAEGTLNAFHDNVCVNTKNHQKIIYVDKPSYETVREPYFCWDISKKFTCHTPKVVAKIIRVPKVINRTELVLECCKGFVELNSKCVAQCPCFHGLCTSPNTCDCHAGYYGRYCSLVCPPGRWGRNCLEDCHLCLHGGTCNAEDGRCHCQPGWQGPRCEFPCNEGFFGLNCQQKCDCYYLPCDHVNGVCYEPETETVFQNLKKPESLLETDIDETSSSQRPTEFSVFKTTYETTNSRSSETKTLSLEEARDDSEETGETFMQSPSAPQTETSLPMQLAGDPTWAIAITTTDTPKTIEDIFRMTETFETSEAANGTSVETTWPSSKGTELSTAETSPTDNYENVLSGTRPGTPEVSTIFETENYVTELPSSWQPPSSPPPTSNTSETTFTDEIKSTTNNNFHHTKINGHNNTTDDGNETGQTLDRSKTADNTHFGNSKDWPSERRPNATTDIQSSGETSGTDSPEITEKDFDIFDRFYSFPFIPSLSVLTGVAFLIILIGARWLALQHKRRNKKILAKKKEDIFRARERQKCKESLFVGKNFPENSVYLYEINLREERPILKTFKPPPGT